MYSITLGGEVAEDTVNDNAEFGKSRKGGDEEPPIIVAQRFLNIFRQLHIFTEERKSAFNKMLLELPPEVRGQFRILPGATLLQEYLDELIEEGGGVVEGGSYSNSSSNKASTILETAKNEAQEQPSQGGSGGGVAGIMNSDNFAKVLANSLAQSNAQIIKELQNIKPYAPAPGGNSGGSISKLVADESFTKVISEALSDAIQNTEQKRQEDNKLITKSFMDLQENLSRLIEQNNQLKIISSSEAPGDAAAVFQVKNIVDDLVKAQSEFLKETTKSQKEELSEIISVAIRESQKLTTQVIADSLKNVGSAKGSPTPITYAATSPGKNPQASMESVEQALKAQGKEFSSIITAALKESQKNSAQAIIETIESLHKEVPKAVTDSSANLKIEEIMKMQAELFREISKSQREEFSHFVASALKESQKQSAETIAAALEQVRSIAPVAAAPREPVYVQQPVLTKPRATSAMEEHYNNVGVTLSHPQALKPISDEELDYEEDSLTSVDEDSDDNLLSSDNDVDGNEEAPKKKKKKKKKKNKNNPEAVESLPIENNQAESVATVSTAPALDNTLQAAEEVASPVTVLEISDSDAEDWGWGYGTSPAEESKPTISEPASTVRQEVLDMLGDDPDINPKWAEENHSLQTTSENSLSDNYTTDNDVAMEESNTDQDWEWEYEEVDGEEGQDWEWDYEEVEGEEGQDWEWEYEEVEEDAAESSTGDWEWEYDDKESSESAGEASEDILNQAELSAEYEYVTEEVIEVPHFDFILLGLEDASFVDPYIENTEAAE